jgi:beta-lactam-binding protein with PASTA domain
MTKFIRFFFSRSFLINLLIALLLFAGGIYLILDYLEDYTLHNETILVPDYQGKIWDDTLGSSNSNLELIISDSIYQKGAEKNLILDQDPSPQTTVKPGRKIYLTVSSSKPPTISMPKLVDLSLRQATSLMEIYGLQIGELSYKPDLCTNCILEQKFNGKNVPAGARLTKGTKIDLVVGQGFSKEKVAVPYLIGSSLEEANLLLKSVSLNIGSITYLEELENAEDSSKAKIKKTVPAYSEEPSIFMGSSIDLYLTLDTNNIDYSVISSDED